MDLNVLADTLERFSDIGIVGCALLFTIAIVTGQVFTKKQVEEIKAAYEARLTILEGVRLRLEDKADRREDARDARRR